MYLNRSCLASFLALILQVFMFPGTINAQEKPAAYPETIKVNYIRIWTATAPVVDPGELLTRPLGDVKQTTQYYDGLGRLLQTVARQQSQPTNGTAVDLVSPVVYDAFGRETFQFLPFAANGTDNNPSISDGLFKHNPFQQQAAFYNSSNTASPLYDQDETYYYSRTNFEASPLNRVDQVLAPGNSWVGAGRGVSTKYWLNTIADDVKKWRVTEETGGPGTYSVNGSYPAGELHKTVTADELGKQVIEFRDKEGQVVLKKVQLTAAADEGGGSGYAGWLCTYYLYDELKQLRTVIQPKGVEALSTNLNWVPDATLLSEQCFRYGYDTRIRINIKKVPGAATVYMVYDIRDRLVFVQDGNLRTHNQWLATLYDGLNRPVLTGLINYTGAQEALQQLVTTQTGSGGETVIEGVTVNKDPVPAGAPLDVLTVTYYDDHGWASSLSTALKDFNTGGATAYLQTASNTTVPYAQAVQASTATKGLITGTKVKVLGSGPAQYLTTVNFYDDKARLIQTRSQNITDGIDVVTMQYSWSGQPLVTVQEQEKKGNLPHTATVATQMHYDDLNRLVSIKKKVRSSGVDNGAVPGDWTTIVENEYDALGQLKSKKLGNKYSGETGALTGEPLTQLDYAYNIRGWLNSVNKDYLTATEAQTPDRYFGMELGYDKNGFESTYAPQYTGNISGTIWKNAGDGQKRKYDFSYDPANRLTGAAFGQYQEGPGTGPEAEYNVAAGIDFSVSNLGYDANGNIQHMEQKGVKGTGSEVIDNLSYHYYPGSNKLQNVLDAINDPQTKLGDFRSSQAYLTSLGGTKTENATDYTYDANGNLIKDLNKDIDNATTNGIEYNHLNLPEKIHIKGKGTIEYTYDAAGNKLRKTVTDQTTNPQPMVTTTLYLNGFEYKNDTLQQLAQEEGRIRYEQARENTCSASPIPARLVYDYFIKDHLGNTRLVLTEETQKDCYPAATVEAARVATEKLIYNITDNRIVDKSSTGATATSLEERLYRTHGGVQGEKTGLELVLKVMSGDEVTIRGESFYNLPGGNAGSPLTLALEDLLAGFVGSGPVSGKGITAAGITGITGNALSLANFLSTNNPGSTTAKAAVNWILLDEQFKYMAADFDGVQPGGGYKEHTKFINTPVSITKSGYLYIYVSNESNLPVFFDNLQVTHKKSPILETTDYYPFGLTMAGISSTTIGKLENRKEKFNEAEYCATFDLNIYEFHLRTYDPQIGRWQALDTKPTDVVSLYAAMSNNPIRYADPLGDTLALFRPDGTFWKFQDDGQKEWSGMFYQRSKVAFTYEENGVNYEIRTYSEGKAFEFNDPAVDIQAIKNGTINRVEMMSDAMVERQISRSGVKTAEAQENPMSFANKQGRQGYMDYGVKGIRSGDLRTNTFYIRENYAYNVGDIGNYLWGRGMAELGVYLGTASIGAHVNNMANGRRDKTPLYDFGPGTYGKPGLFDSQGDQRAISRGYLSTPKGVALWKKETRDWPNYNPK